jgi:hypothetical protein
LQFFEHPSTTCIFSIEFPLLLDLASFVMFVRIGPHKKIFCFELWFSGIFFFLVFL